MEYLLINHPLDCPVCDQAGECYLQDYSYEYGRSQSRFEEDKVKNPKKDVGDNIYLYSDRCIMCTRCVRFTREVSGHQRAVRGWPRAQGRDRYFPRQAAATTSWPATSSTSARSGRCSTRISSSSSASGCSSSAPSISPADSGGENIYLEYNEGVIYRIKPRYNADVNQWWISDDTRYSATRPSTTRSACARPGGRSTARRSTPTSTRRSRTPTAGLKDVVAKNGAGSLYALLSPMMACEEAWLLGKAIRAIDPQAVLILGPVPTTGQDEVFKNSGQRQADVRDQGRKGAQRRRHPAGDRHARRPERDLGRAARRHAAGAREAQGRLDRRRVSVDLGRRRLRRRSSRAGSASCRTFCPAA